MSVQLIVVLSLYVLAWQTYQLRTRLTRLANVALLITLIGVLAVPAVDHAARDGLLPIDRLQLSALLKVVILVPCVALYVFRLASDGHRLSSPRVLLTLGSGTGVAVLYAVLGVRSIQAGDPLTESPHSYAQLSGFVYYGLGGLYYGSLLVAVAIWMVSRSRAADPVLRWGVRAASLGVFAMGAISLIGVVPPFVVFFGGPPWTTSVALKGWVSLFTVPFVFGGLALPILVSRAVAVRAWMHDRRALARITPLWDLGRTIYPEVVLPAGPDRRASFLLERRRGEVFDMLYQLQHDVWPSGRPPTPGSDADLAVRRLRAAVGDVERSHLGGTSLWRTIAPEPDTVARTSDAVTYRLLDTLADRITTAAPTRPAAV